MNWTLIVVGLVILLGLSFVVGLVKSLLRLGIALIVGVLAALAATWIVDALGVSESVPDAAVLVVGALASLSVLIKRR
jgi:hypothetical protein